MKLFGPQITIPCISMVIVSARVATGHANVTKYYRFPNKSSRHSHIIVQPKLKLDYTNIIHDKLYIHDN